MKTSRKQSEAAEPSVLPDDEEKNHFPLDFAKGNYRKYLLPLLIYLLITLIVFWPVALNITSVVAAGKPGYANAGSSDVYQNLWSLWWVNYAIIDLHTSPYFTHFLFYPVGSNLATETLSPLAGIFSSIFQSVNLLFAYNIIFILGFVLSAFFSFILTDYVIKNKYGAFIAGIIFAFSAFHIDHALNGHLNWTSIEFLPLFILFFLLMIKDKKLFSILGTSLSFLLLVFFGDPEEGIMGLVFVIILLLIKLLNPDNRKEILNRKFLISVSSALIIIIIIGLPFLIPIVQGIMNGALGLANASSTINNNIIWSNPLLSFFFPSPYNNIFATISNSYSNIYITGIDSAERVSYIGYTVLFLVTAAIFKDWKKTKFRRTAAWIFIGIIFAWLSLGPYPQMGALPNATSLKTSPPGIFLLYKNIPVLNLIREPGRFDLVVTLCLAIVAGLGFSEIIEHIQTKGINKKYFNYFALFVTMLILMECSGIPLTGSYISAYFLKPTIPSGYYQLANVSGNFSVVVMPMLSSLYGKITLYQGMSMWYQTAFRKPIVGGYTSRENATDDYIRLNMPLSVATASLQAGGLFAYGSPITQNYTNVTLLFLSKYRAGFISTINQAFTTNELMILAYYLNSTFGPPMYANNLTSIWPVSNAVQHAQNKSVVAYISQGNWTMGCAVLGQILCNSSQDTLWYGPNLRAINVSVPQNKTKLIMRFSAASLNNNVTLYLFLTSDQHQLGAAKLSHKITNYQLNLTLNPGTSALFFVAPNITIPNVDQLFDFGLKNITFRPV